MDTLALSVMGAMMIIIVGLAYTAYKSHRRAAESSKLSENSFKTSAVLVLSRQNPELEAIIVEAANSLDISLADLQAFARLTFGELFAEALVAPQPQPLSAPPTSAPATPLTKYMNPAYNGNAAGDSAASNGIVAVHAMCNQERHEQAAALQQQTSASMARIEAANGYTTGEDGNTSDQSTAAGPQLDQILSEESENEETRKASAARPPRGKATAAGFKTELPDFPEESVLADQADDDDVDDDVEDDDDVDDDDGGDCDGDDDGDDGIGSSDCGLQPPLENDGDGHNSDGHGHNSDGHGHNSDGHGHNSDGDDTV